METFPVPDRVTQLLSSDRVIVRVYVSRLYKLFVSLAQWVTEDEKDQEVGVVLEVRELKR